MRKNNFDFLRFFAAFLVLWGHACYLIKAPIPAFWGMGIQTFGVVIFFSLSGYLVSESWARQPQLWAFFRKRSLRIFPALIASTAMTVLAGWWFTTLSSRDYWAHPVTWAYFTNVVLYIRYFLPDVFVGNPALVAVNGSLWSLPVEFACYICVAFAGVFVSLRRLLMLILLIAAGAWGLFGVVTGKIGTVVLYATDVFAALSVAPYFLVAGLINWHRGEIRNDVALLLCLLLLVAESSTPLWAFTALKWLAIPYVVLAIGTSATWKIPQFGRVRGRHYDLSYGVYLYSFPVTQAIISASGGTIGLFSLVAYTTIISCICAAISWRLVEAPALQLK